jgi:hypothetical protein
MVEVHDKPSSGHLISKESLPVSQIFPSPLQVSDVALPLLSVMFLVRPSSVQYLLNAFLVLFPDFFSSLVNNSRGPNDYQYDKAFHIRHSLNFYI